MRSGSEEGSYFRLIDFLYHSSIGHTAEKKSRGPVPLIRRRLRILAPPGLGFGVWGLGFGVWGLGFGVWGLGFGVWGVGCGVWDLGLGVGGWGFGVWGLGFRVSGVRVEDRV